jgi:glycosyltransferase involved in cell wall biosynthesis
MKTILILSFSNLATDPRVNRQIRFLSDRYRVVAAGLADPGIEGVEFIPLVKEINRLRLLLPALKLLARRYESWYWGQNHIRDCLSALSHVRADLFLTNDLDALPVALRLARGGKVIFDAHEYAPRQYEDVFQWRLLFQEYSTYLCKTYIPRVHGMTTVCPGIAEAYEKDTGVKPLVITSAPDYEDLEPNLLDQQERKIRLIHHGIAGPSRKIEHMIRMMDFLDDRFELNLMFIPANPGYIKFLKKLGAKRPHVRFLPPQPMRTLSRYLHQFDIGVSLIAPTNFNYFHILPNKFFECIQARLALAVGPSPEMARIVKEYDLGVVADNFTPEALAERLRNLDQNKINHYKLQSHRAARLLSAEENKKLLLRLVEQVLQG